MKQIDYVGLPYIVKDFLVYMDVIKNKSKLTIEEYSSDLRLFLKFLKMYKGLVPSSIDFNDIDITDIGDAFIKEITLNDAYAFLSYCKNERDNHEAARARKVSSIRAFFKYLTMQKQILDENPMQVLDSPKLKKALPKYLTLEECLKLLKNIDGKNKERDYCIFVFFLNCGLRLSELVGLNYNDIRDNHTMKVTGKGNKERTIYLNDACMEAYAHYMAVRPVDGIPSSDRAALFLSNRNKRISPKTVQHIVYTYLEKCGLEGYSVHKLRHTAATLMYQHGNVDVLVLKDILGHENLGTTEIYTHLVDEQLKQASEANPLASVKFKE
jgi:site-specific recombinase XerD